MQVWWRREPSARSAHSSSGAPRELRERSLGRARRARRAAYAGLGREGPLWPRFGRFSGLPRMVGGCRLCQMLCFSMGHMLICVVRVFVVVRKSRFFLSSPLSFFFELSWFERKTRKKNFMFLADTYLCIRVESSCQGGAHTKISPPPHHTPQTWYEGCGNGAGRPRLV